MEAIPGERVGRGKEATIPCWLQPPGTGGSRTWYSLSEQQP